MQVSCNRKPTHSGRYLNFNSAQPCSHKKAVLHSLMHGARTLVSSEEEQKLEVEKVKHDLRLNNYSNWFVNQEMVPKSNEKDTNFKASVVLP